MWGSGAGCLSCVRTYLQVTVGQGCRLFKQCQNLPPWHWGQGAGCLSCVRIYLPGTVGQGCRLFKRCRNLPSGHCRAVVQDVNVELERMSRALVDSGAGCLSCVRAYLQGTVGQGCRLLTQCWKLPPWHCGPGCRLFKLLRARRN